MTKTNHVPISKRLVLINSASNVATRLLNISVFAWAIQYLIHRVPQDELAVMWVVTSVALFLPIFQSVLTAGLARFVTEAYAKGDMRRVTEIVSSMAPILFGAAIGLLLLGVLLAWTLPPLLEIDPAYVGAFQFMLMLVVARMAFAVSVTAHNTGIVVRQKFILNNVIQVIGSVIKIVLMLWLILGVSPNVVWVVVSQVAGGLWMNIATTLVSRRMVPAQRFRPSYFRWDVVRQVSSYGQWYLLGKISAGIREAADVPILQRFAMAIDVNTYAIGAFVNTQIRQATLILGQPLMPALTAMHALGQHERLGHAYIRGGRILLWVSMSIAVPLILLRIEFLKLYLGDAFRNYESSATVMALLLLTYPFMYSSGMLTRIMDAKINIGPITRRSFAGQIFNLVATLVLVIGMGMGAVGSALATFATSLIMCVVVYWPFAIREFDLKWLRFIKETLLRGLTPAVGSAGVLYLMKLFVSLDSLINLGLGLVLYSIVYAALVASVSTVHDRKDFRKILDATFAKIKLGPNDADAARV
jgi:O-antigen/teichoic acid export membrane protein